MRIAFPRDTAFPGLVGFIAGVIAHLIHGPAKTESDRSPASAVPAAEPGAIQRHGYFIVRHWRGELPLWVSYWVVNIIGNLCAVVVLTHYSTREDFLPTHLRSLHASQPRTASWTHCI
jgi:hypothetical protein